MHYAPIQDIYTDKILPQMPLAIHQVQPLMDLNVRVKHGDLERGQYVGP